MLTLNKNNILLPGILLLALLSRLMFIDQYPPSLNWDEVSHGYNAYSILKTGKDEWGNFMPTIFRAYGDYKLPVYIYSTVPFVAIFGLTELAVRLPSILAGTLAVLFVYLFAREVRKDKSNAIAFLSALLMAISPWSFFLSRIALEANVALTLIISGSFFFLRGLKLKNWNFILAIVLFGLSVWTYNSARVFVPLLLLGGLFIYRKEINKLSSSTKYISLIVGLLFFVPMFWQLINPTGSARYENVKIIDQGAIAGIEERRNSSTLPSILPKIIHNKVAFAAGVFAKNYVAHFSPQFLFLEGGDHYQFNVPGHGLLYIATMPFFIAGLYIILKNLSTKSNQFLLSWLLFAPIASSLTREAPHALRAIVILPIPMILIAIGFSLFRKVTNHQSLITWSSIGIILVLFISYLNKYQLYSQKFSWSWQYGYEDVAKYLKDNYDKYDNIVITKKYGEPHEFLLFYLQYNPAKYQTDPNLIRFYQSNWYWIDGFDKFYFANDWEIPSQGYQFILESKQEVDCQNKKCLLVTAGESRMKDWNLVDTIDFLDGSPAFAIYENE